MQKDSQETSGAPPHNPPPPTPNTHTRTHTHPTHTPNTHTWMLSRRPARAYDASVTRLTMPRVIERLSPPTG